MSGSGEVAMPFDPGCPCNMGSSSSDRSSSEIGWARAKPYLLISRFENKVLCFAFRNFQYGLQYFLSSCMKNTISANVKGYISASQGVVLLYKYFGKAQSLDKGPESCLGLIQDPFKPMRFFCTGLDGLWIWSSATATTNHLMNESWMKNFLLPHFVEAAKEERQHCF